MNDSEKDNGPVPIIDVKEMSDALKKKLAEIDHDFIDLKMREKREKEWKSKLRIVLNGNDMVEFNTMSHTAWKNTAIQNAVNKDTQPEDPNKGKKKTVQMAIDLFNARGFTEKEDYRGGVPYPADHEKHNWEKQKGTPNQRKIMIKMPDGKDDKFSPSYTNMQQRSTTSETSKKNKAAGNLKISGKKIHLFSNFQPPCFFWKFLKLLNAAAWRAQG